LGQGRLRGGPAALCGPYGPRRDPSRRSRSVARGCDARRLAVVTVDCEQVGPALGLALTRLTPGGEVSPGCGRSPTCLDRLPQAPKPIARDRARGRRLRLRDGGTRCPAGSQLTVVGSAPEAADERGLIREAAHAKVVLAHDAIRRSCSLQATTVAPPGATRERPGRVAETWHRPRIAAVACAGCRVGRAASRDPRSRRRTPSAPLLRSSARTACLSWVHAACDRSRCLVCSTRWTSPSLSRPG
jgi:hypothetical protein